MFDDTAAFVDPEEPEVIQIVELPETPDDDPIQFYRVLNHEFLHVLFYRLGFNESINHGLDRFVELRANRCLISQIDALLIEEVGL